MSSRLPLVALSLFILLTTSKTPVRAEGPIEIVRVRTPANRVSACFPAGASLRTMPTTEFDALVAQAESAASKTSVLATGRPIRVEHTARWDGSILTGRSRVSLPATLGSERAAIITCDPWSPAVLESPDRAAFIRSDEAGRLVLVQPSGQPARSVEILWSQAAQANSGGAVFALALPDADLATFDLDLPTDATVTTVAPSNLRAPTADRAVWKFAGASGRWPIQIHPGGPSQTSGPGPWFGGPTRIDLNATGANFVADWRVEASSGGPMVARFALDPGLELIDVTGAEVQEFHRVVADRSEVEVTLREPEPGYSHRAPIAIRAHATVPLAGLWSIPTVRPVAGSGWLGGRTEVGLDPARAVVAITERSGWRVAPRTGNSSTPTLWVFESDGRPGPVADLRLAPPTPDASVAIDGTLRLGSRAPRIDLVATWTVSAGRLLDPTLDLPAGWVVDGVALIGDERRGRFFWSVEPLALGVSRVHLDGASWSSDPTLPQSTSVRVTAIRPGATTEPTGVGPLDLPRVRPGAGPIQVAEERWVALIEPGYQVVPQSSRGLVWDDPPASAPAESAWQQLAWRWLEVDARATIDRRLDRSETQVDERLEAAIGGGRLHLVWYWTITGGGRPESLPFRLDLDPTNAPRWRRHDQATGPVVAAPPLTHDRRAALGWPESGLAAELVIRPDTTASIKVRGETDLPWSGSGTIPLTRFAGSVRVRRSVVVRVEDATQCRVDRVEELVAVGRGEVGDPTVTPDSESSPYRAMIGEDEPGWRVAGAWLGVGDADHLELTTLDAPRTPGVAGLITEASLTSRLAPGSPGRHRLVLRLAPGSTRTLEMKLPSGALVDRVRCDGQPAVVTTDGSTLQINLARAEPNRLASTMTLDYRTGADPSPTGRVQPAALLPITSLACLSFTWQVNAPDRFAVISESPDLIPTDLTAEVADRTGFDPGTASAAETMWTDLDRVVASVPAAETTLGDWLVKLDAGPWPLVIDRLTLLSVGLGPRSRINAAGLEPAASRSGSARAVFGLLGLAVEPMGATFLVTTQADQRPDGGRTLGTTRQRAAGQVLLDASVAGSDRSDRFQSPSRWRSETTPRAWLASETPDRGLVALGWRTHRFAASTWPASSLAIRLVDAHSNQRSLGWIAVGAGLVGLLLGSVRLALQRQRPRLALGLLLILALATPALARLDRDEPILVALPYNDLSQIDAPAARVVLLATDHDRLTRLARPVVPEHSIFASVAAVTHRISRGVGDGSAVVRSEYQLDLAGSSLGGPFRLPIGKSFDLTATVGGQAVPLVISPDGTTATIVRIPGGQSALVVQRSVPIRSDPGRDGGSIDLPVTRSALARVEVEVAPTTDPATVALPDLTGRRTVGPGFVAGELGPATRLVVGWNQVSPDRRPRSAWNALVRWDAARAGDLLTARLTVTGPEAVRSLRVDLEPGLAVIGQTIPGLVGITLVDGGDQPGWVAHVDPPLRAGSSIELALWRPRTETGPTRTCPRWTIPDAEITALIGLRKPEGWAARLITPPGEITPGESEFMRAWGPAPPDGFTFSSLRRSDLTRPVVAEVARGLARFEVRDRLAAQVVPGEIQIQVDSFLTGRLGPILAAEAIFDGPVRLDRVEAAGLASWSQPTPDRLRLIFTAAGPSRDLAVHLEGRVAVVPTGPESTISAALPWPRWRGASTNPGKLTVEAPAGWTVRTGDRTISEESAFKDPSGPSATRTIRHAVLKEDGVFRLTGTSMPARVNVTIASDVRLDEGRAVWSADVECEITAGSVGTLYWQLPQGWAEQARLRPVAGTMPVVEVEQRGDATVWAITFAEPVWSRRTLTIESTRAMPPGLALAYPELVPLSVPGRGSVIRHDLTITNLAGAPLTLINPGGVIPLNHSRAQSESSAVPGGVVSRAFRVQTEPWSLGLLIRREPPVEPTLATRFDTGRSLAWVERCDFQTTLDTSARLQGRADCLIKPGAAFLAVHLADEAAMVGASVEGRPVTPIRSSEAAPSRWLIPLGDRGGRRVAFGWVQAAGTSAATIGQLPSFQQAAILTTLQVASTDEKNTLSLTGGTWERLTPSQARFGRFERLAVDLIAAAMRTDRATTNDSTAILDGLVTLKLDLRAAARGAREPDDAPRPDLAAWLVVQERVQTAMLAAGLSSLVNEAQQRAGLAPTELDPTRVAPPEDVPDPFQIRRLGRVESFAGTTSGDQPPVLIRGEEQ